MNPTDDDPTFLRGLVKEARQRPHLVRWVDRDGTERHSLLSQVEASRLNALARGRGVSPGETLRQAAHVPVAK